MFYPCPISSRENEHIFSFSFYYLTACTPVYLCLRVRHTVFQRTLNFRILNFHTNLLQRLYKTLLKVLILWLYFEEKV